MLRKDVPGSKLILMAPNDPYLCIVRSPSDRPAGDAGTFLLPFEGDSPLTIILSQAFLLAGDKTEDETILRQIRP